MTTKVDTPVKFCDGCTYLSPTEREQKELGNNPAHMCTYYNERLMHLGHRPRIVRLNKCTKFTQMEFDDPRWHREGI